ncbi:HlyD family efflux transporter periplasmic adaptor subunit [Salipiger abyssi]|uniref:HlyD family efflux transporter periplasmic adaptor subunit n=1 Tax=Salipiger abyssi TaxID=1250539 RepID=UPI0009788127|nr:HlyD family secretion protein [Salipiger abyssi]
MSAAAVLVGAVATAVAPHATNYISTSAVVNAPLVPISSPFEGIVETPSPGPARFIRAGELAFELRKMSKESAGLRSLKSELSSLSGEIEGLEMQRERLEQLKQELLERRDQQIAARSAWYETRLLEARAELDRAEGALHRVIASSDRAERLAARDRLSESDLIEAQGELAEAKAVVAGREATLKRLEVERDFLAEGDVIDTSTNDIDAIAYRLDEIAVRDAELATQLMGRSTRREALLHEISGMQIEQTKNEEFRPTSATDGIVWESSPRAGANVTTGEQVLKILDCTRRFLEFELPERHFEKIVPGTEVSVRLKGAEKPFTGKIFAAYGGGSRPNRNMQAAQPRITTPNGLRVIVTIPKPDLEDENVARAFCDVGRSAEVRMNIPSGSVASEWMERAREVARAVFGRDGQETDTALDEDLAANEDDMTPRSRTN